MADAASRHPPSEVAPKRSAGLGRKVLFRVRGTEPSGPDLLTVLGSIGRTGPRRLQLVGELCAHSAPLLEAHLESEPALGGSDIILDTSGLTFVDSTGIAGFLALRQRWHERGRSLVIADPSDVLCRVVRILGLEDLLFRSWPSVEPLAAAPLEAPTVEVRNLDRGQTIEVRVAGVVDPSALDALVRRLELLATKRQPATLRLDLADAVIDLTAAEPIGRVAASLEELGSRMVVLGGSPTLERAVPPQQRRALTFAPAGAAGSDRRSPTSTT